MRCDPLPIRFADVLGIDVRDDSSQTHHRLHAEPADQESDRHRAQPDQ